MKEVAKMWIEKKFRQYYSNANIRVYKVNEREFGIGTFDKKIAKRHIAFFSNLELNKFLREKAPPYISYSVAYYNDPSATPMEKKGWKGAELVFDLDAESIDEEGLEEMKKDVFRLLDMLKDDFGVKDIHINFSGNRGYHIHVRDEEFLSLGGEERQRIIEYIKGMGFNYKKLFDGTKGPKPTEGGIGGRFARYILNTLKEKPTKLSRKFNNEELLRKAIEQINSGEWRLIIGLVSENRLSSIANEINVKTANIDAGVTQDIKKLIRMPMSLHGSTGFLVKVMDENELERFNPFRDAVVFSSKRGIRVKFLEDVDDHPIHMLKNKRKGEITVLPEWVAIYGLLKGIVDIP